MSLLSLFGTHYQTDKILRNTPSWWDKTPLSGDQPGSNFYALLAALGESDWYVGGYEPMVFVVEGTGVGTAGTYTVSGANWTANDYRGYLLEDADAVNHVRKARYEIESNTSNTLTLTASTVTPVSGAFRILRPCSAESEVRYDVQLRTAEYLDLDIKGRNVGVPRMQSGLTDTLYRKLIPILSWGPKLYRPAIEGVLSVLIGTKGTDWNCFELNAREIIIEIYKSTTLPDGYGTYLRPVSTDVAPVSSPIPGYMTSAFGKPGPTPVHAVYLAGTFIMTDGTLVDAEFIQRVLRTYCRAVGVKVTVEFLGV